MSLLSNVFKSIGFVFVMIFSFSSFAKEDTSSVNPIFRDSVLKNKVDSAKWSAILNKVDIHKKTNHYIIQKQKHTSRSLVFLYISTAIFLLLLIMRLLFDDFSFSMLEGIVSFKKFLIFYQSKKYDSLIAIIFVYLLSLVILSLVTYIGIQQFSNDDFTTFNATFFIQILTSLSIFFTLKNIIEYVFNSVVSTQKAFSAFFLQNLFSELILSVVLVFLLIIYIYNTNLSPNFAVVLLVCSIALYLVFNTIRSYQLMRNIQISYKQYFFLYICAFKIIPMLLLVKYILNNVTA
jgi:hypothetical protein